MLEFTHRQIDHCLQMTSGGSGKGSMCDWPVGSHNIYKWDWSFSPNKMMTEVCTTVGAGEQPGRAAFCPPTPPPLFSQFRASPVPRLTSGGLLPDASENGRDAKQQLFEEYFCTLTRTFLRKRSKTLRNGYLMDAFQRNWEIFLDTKEGKKKISAHCKRE